MVFNRDPKIQGLGWFFPGLLHPFATCGSTCVVAGVDLVRREALVLVALGNIGEREYEAGVCVWVVTLDSNLKDGSLCDGSQCLFYFQLNFGKPVRLTCSVIFSINALESDQLIQDGWFPCSRLKISRHGLDCWNITLYPGYSATSTTTTTNYYDYDYDYYYYYDYYDYYDCYDYYYY